MKIGLVAFLFIALASCSTKDKPDKDNSTEEKLALLNADKAFSAMSEEKGMKTAFIEFIDSNGVLLRPNMMPIIGAGAIDYLISLNDSSYTLKWQPQHAEVAKSADLGYTYGLYALHPKSVDTVIYGTYVSIWKKQDGGGWKFVLDTGNEGVGDAD
ncbi:MAG: hypothetical protein JWQ27_2876 [Ferruginibacter sp.]|nr:hypothetical protein [Ferruginibacter sp.]